MRMCLHAKGNELVEGSINYCTGGRRNRHHVAAKCTPRQETGFRMELDETEGRTSSQKGLGVTEWTWGQTTRGRGHGGRDREGGVTGKGEVETGS